MGSREVTKILEKDKPIWEKFFQTAIAFKAAKPWETMLNADVFGLEDPVTSEIYWCAVMGNAGELFALSMYEGQRGFDNFNDVFEYVENEADMFFVGLSQEGLMVEFVDRAVVEKEDLEKINTLNLKFRGKNNWVVARQIEPFFRPWHINAAQAALLTLGMEQTLLVADRIKNKTISSNLEDKEQLLVFKVDKKSKDGIVWKEEIMSQDDMGDSISDLVFDEDVLKEVSRLPKKEQQICIFLEQMGVLDDPNSEHRAGYVFMLLFVDYNSGMILTNEVLSPINVRRDLFLSLASSFLKLGYMPKDVLCNSEKLCAILSTITIEVDSNLYYAANAPHIDDIREHFASFRN